MLDTHETFAAGAGNGASRFSTRALRNQTGVAGSRRTQNRLARLTESGRASFSRRTSNAAGGPNRGFQRNRSAGGRARAAGRDAAETLASARRRQRRLRNRRRR